MDLSVRNPVAYRWQGELSERAAHIGRRSGSLGDLALPEVTPAWVRIPRFRRRGPVEKSRSPLDPAKIQLDFTRAVGLIRPFSIFMKATIHTQGKQFTVSEGDVLVVDRFPSAEVGSKIEITEVLTASEGADLRIGKPYLPEAVVTATVVEHKRGKKIIVFKKRRRKGYERKQGHRQDQTVIQIDTIKA
jgi:large subunit ribosomal protein L21